MINSMDRALPAGIIIKARVKKILIAAAIIIILFISIKLLRIAISPTLDRDKIRTAVAEIGMIEASVSASGTVVPGFEQVIAAPISTTIDTIFLKSGDLVNSGQAILRLNREMLLLSCNRTKNELELQKNDKWQMELTIQRKQIDLQAAYDVKEMQSRFIQSQYERARRLYEIGGMSREDLDRMALNVDIATRELDQMLRQIENQKSSMAADLTGLDLKIDIQKARLQEIQHDLALSEARADRDGVVTWVNDNIGSAVNRGDVLARVADLGSYKIEATISDIHADKLTTGGPIKVRIGDNQLDGRITSISPAVQNGIITFMIELDDDSNTLLRPNLRTDIAVITSFADDVTRVRKGPFYRGVVDQPVFVVQGDKAVRKMVDIGVSNYDWVELKGDINAGDEIIISDMDDYRHMSEVSIDEN